MIGAHQNGLPGFRPEVLTDPNYEANEPIEPDDGLDLDQHDLNAWYGTDDDLFEDLPE